MFCIEWRAYCLHFRRTGVAKLVQLNPGTIQFTLCAPFVFSLVSIMMTFAHMTLGGCGMSLPGGLCVQGVLEELRPLYVNTGRIKPPSSKTD